MHIDRILDWLHYHTFPGGLSGVKGSTVYPSPKSKKTDNILTCDVKEKTSYGWLHLRGHCKDSSEVYPALFFDRVPD